MSVSRILIANRGEIACRIIATCRRMGLESIAVYSDADEGALHTRLADDAIRIGPAEAARSYGNADAVMSAALASGADAIHPGYGFLSERAALPRLCEAHGLAWIGPSAACIERMGSKIEAKRIARDAGIACVPGYDGDDQSDERLAREAASIGYPVLVKASAGGGGRGMRRVMAADGLADALASARAEAQAAFGSPVLLLEKLIRTPAPPGGPAWPATATATSCTCSSANARSSATTRRSSRRLRLPTSPNPCGKSCSRRRCASAGPSATTAWAPPSSSWRTAATGPGSWR